MSLFIMKVHEQDLLQMNFEQILNFISEKPKVLLSETIETPGGEESMYMQIKRATKDMQFIEFTLERLEKEFRDSHEASNHFKKVGAGVAK
jgi:hypothetical protein